MEADRVLLEQGDIINERYEVCEKIGTGGMAIVYRAIDKKLSRSVTLKVMRAEYASDEEFLKRFSVEARAAACISHQNLVNVYDVGSEGLVNYIVMEYIDGVTLKDLIKKKAPFNSEETLGVAIQVATALEHAHKNGIIHRDIKPQNILITKEGIVKVTDFGIARAASEATLTSSGNTMGSVHYFSPEQARGIYVDYKSDIYSLGIVMFEMATGTLPFEGETPVAIALKHINDPLPEIRTLNPEVSESLVKIITLATQKLSAKRYQTVEELSNHLKRALTNATGDFIRSADDGDATVSPTINLTPEDVAKIRNGARAIFFNNNDPDAEDDEDDGSEAKTERKVIFAAVLTSLAIIAAICWALYNLYMRSLPVRVEVPQFTGLDVASASELARDLNLILSEVGSRYSDGEPEGVILEQMIERGDIVTEGESVPVVVSLGTDKILIPDVVGRTYLEAYDVFDLLPFRTSIEETYDEEIPIYTVVRQEPLGGSFAESGSDVTIYISIGPESAETEVPYVREYTEEAAKQALIDAKLTVGTVNYMESPSIAEGYVISQTVPPGRIVDTGTEVGLMVSSGTGTAAETVPTQSPEPSESPAPEPSPTPEPEPSPTPEPEAEPEVTWPLVLALPYTPEGVDTIEYQLIKTTSAGSWVEVSGTAKVSDFPIIIDVKGTGETRYDFYINDGGYKLQSTENINFTDIDAR